MNIHLKYIFFTICFSDGDSKKAECDNSTNSTIPVARTPAAGGHGGGAGETGHYDRTQCHHWGK